MNFSIIKFFAALSVLLIAVYGRPVTAGARSPELSLRDLLRFRIENGGVPLNISVGSEPIHAAIVLPIFYERRVYQPAWSDHNGPLPHAAAVLEAVRRADREGLRPADYHLAKIEAMLAEVRHAPGVEMPSNARMLVDLDLLLTDAFLIYGSHLLAGRVDPQKIHPQWFTHRREADLARLLEDALGANRIGETLAACLPQNPAYTRLREMLALYRRLAETGWPAVPAGGKLKPGDRSESISLLRQRLTDEGYLGKTETSDPAFFDSDLEQALREFQLQNSLEIDGIPGPQTVAALNISAGDRVRQIAANMERWRWLPQDLGDRYILVNIAGFNLDVIERETPLLNMRVVVGRTYRKTPVFSDRISYLVINPYWGVPDSIARKDILPKLKKTPSYLIEQKIRVFEGSRGEARELEPDRIDWGTVTADNFPYQFKQDPGPQNALGRIKFMFPNQFNVYLHDTPSKELFGKSRRDFSSGCIRVEKPVELAEYLLRDHPDWPPENIRAALMADDFATRTVALSKPLNIHILYWTVWIGPDDRIYFSPDIYDRDAAVDQALQTPPPSS